MRTKLEIPRWAGKQIRELSEDTGMVSEDILYQVLILGINAARGQLEKVIEYRKSLEVLRHAKPEEPDQAGQEDNPEGLTEILGEISSRTYPVDSHSAERPGQLAESGEDIEVFEQADFGG
jgi:hypothetical protein